MPNLVEDAWINEQAVNHPVTEIEDCAIAVEARYYLQLFLDTAPFHEPLLPALGGLTGIQKHIESDLDQWKAHNVIPFFVFDGQSVTGQDEISLAQGLRANDKTDHAWELYFSGRATEAVSAFGANSGAFRPQSLYPMLQGILKQRQLHFLVPPYNAAAQIAYFDMVDSDQCGGIMGSQELLLYPIKDSIIRSIDWDASTVTAISKKNIIKALNVSEHLFTEALLMTGTSFLPPFPALLEPTLIKVQPFTISDAVNMLRTSDKSVTIACTSSFNDIVKLKDPNWLDKYQKACMAISHFIYIAENGEVQVNDYEHLTGDNHEYLGLQLPSELFHYLNTGLIGPRMLGWITHGQLMVLPTTDGVASDEYKKLVSSQLVPIKEMTLGLLIPQLHRGIQHKSITMKVWYDRNYSYTVNHRNLQPSFIRIAGWDVKEGAIKEHFPKFAAGSIASEVLALKNLDFAKATVTKEKVKGLQSGDIIVSLTIWRLLQLRGYVNDGHTLTDWGNALATSMSAFEPTVKQHPDVPHLYEAILVAFELLRFELLNARNKHEELRGLALNGTEDDQASLLLISRCSTLLKLRHEANGYTGPLSKNLLAFRSLVSEVRSADRDLTEALIASMFMNAQAKRDRDDGWRISHRLPFLSDPDVALGIAVKTYLDEISPSDTPEQKNLRKQQFPSSYLPYALRFSEDLDICCAFFDAIHAGVKALGTKEIPASDMAAWDKAAKYLELRR